MKPTDRDSLIEWINERRMRLLVNGTPKEDYNLGRIYELQRILTKLRDERGDFDIETTDGGEGK